MAGKPHIIMASKHDQHTWIVDRDNILSEYGCAHIIARHLLGGAGSHLGEPCSQLDTWGASQTMFCCYLLWHSINTGLLLVDGMLWEIDS